MQREAVDILVRGDGGDDLLRVDVARQWQLHQDAVHGRISVERGDSGQQFGFGQARVVAFEDRAHPAFLTRLDLVAHVDLACRIVAHQDHGQPRRVAARAQRRSALCHLGAHLARKGDAVDELRRHGPPAP
jgi:hypothetical protein